MSETRTPNSSPRQGVFADAVVRRFMIIGIVAGALVGLAIGGIVLYIVGTMREAAVERENQQMLDDWNAQQQRKRDEERRWR